MDQKWKVWILAAVLAALAMVPFVLQRGKLNEARAENSQLQAQMQELRRELARSGTNAVASTNQQASGALSNQQLLELMRLRAEVTALRKLTNSFAGAIPAPAPASAPLEAPAAEAGPVPVLTTNSAPFAYRGFASPEDTLSTMVWAMNEGRIDMLLSSATPEEQAKFQQAYAAGGTNPAERLKREASEIVEIKPSPNHPPTENEVYMSMVIHRPAQQLIAEEPIQAGGHTIQKGQPYTMSAQVSEELVKLQRVGNEWKFAGKAGAR